MRLKNILLLLCASLVMCSCGGKIEKMTKAQYLGDDVRQIAQIERDKQTMELLLKVNENTKWELYVGESVEQIDFNKPLAKGKKAGEYKIELPNGHVRYYFQLATPQGAAIIAERLLPMEGGYNFRDLGGFKTRDGRYVKWGMIYRSDDLYALTAVDLDYLSSLPLRSIVDFRSDDEVSSAPDKLPESVENIYAYSISPGDMTDIMVKEMSEEDFEQEMENMNRRMVTESEIVEQYRKFFALLADREQNVPLMFHCSAGKDRTGLAAALILDALGVERGVIFEDYLSSNYYLAGKYDSMIAKNPRVRPLMTVDVRYLQAGFDRIEQRYGSVENYLKNELNVEIDSLRHKYLY